MVQFVLKTVYMSLAVLNLYRCCIILISPFNWLCYVVLSEEPCIWHIKNYYKCIVFYEEL